ncbi:hypothetical protein [Bacillus massilinigeriensis]|uniref:hypothetical protein n=1 Tax=Bacillus massilionigeriensis TaxID=1805475 RepID=UPI000A053844|nr:hypothetical protein [Bacillus massilionigeriensis]
MIKKLMPFLLVIVMSFSLFGCSGGSYRITIGEIEAFNNKIYGEYNSFTGHYFKKIKVKDGETLRATFSADTKKGKIHAKVIDSNGKTIQFLESGETLKLKEPDKYKMQVEGKKHKGEFTLSWEIE